MKFTCEETVFFQIFFRDCVLQFCPAVTIGLTTAFSLFGVVDGKAKEMPATNSLNYSHTSDEIVVFEFTAIAPLLSSSELLVQGNPIRKKKNK